jgi:hypothetical protein
MLARIVWEILRGGMVRDSQVRAAQDDKADAD